MTAAGIALAGWDPFAALLAAAVAGAAAGFLPFNWSPRQRLPGRRGQLLPGVHSRGAARWRRRRSRGRGPYCSWPSACGCSWPTPRGRSCGGPAAARAGTRPTESTSTSTWRCGRATPGWRRRSGWFGGAHRGGAGRVSKRGPGVGRGRCSRWRSSFASSAAARVGAGEIGESGVKTGLAGAPQWFAGRQRLRPDPRPRRAAHHGVVSTSPTCCASTGQIWPEYQAIFRRFLPLFLLVRLSLHLDVRAAPLVVPPLGLLRGAARRRDDCARARRCFSAIIYFLQTPGPPRSVLAMEFFLTASLIGAFRFSPRLAQTWLLAQTRSRSGAARAHADRRRRLRGRPAAARPAALRGALRTTSWGSWTTTRASAGQWIGGRPVLGPIDRLPELADEPRRAAAAVRDPAAARRRALREILAACAEPQAELQDAARLVHLPQRARAPVHARRPLAGSPAAAPRGALRRPRSWTRWCGVVASW